MESAQRALSTYDSNCCFGANRGSLRVLQIPVYTRCNGIMTFMDEGQKPDDDDDYSTKLVDIN